MTRGVRRGSGQLRRQRRAGRGSLSAGRRRGYGDVEVVGAPPCPAVSRRRRGGPRAPAAGSETSPALTAPEVEDEIVWWRKHLDDAGFDAGARTIRYHLSQAHQSVPSLSTVHRVLRRRGLVVDQPQKRPRSSWVRFEAALANECWQSDITHWHVGEEKVEILHFIDDCSRAVLSSKVLRTATAPETIELFYGTSAIWGLPACVLSDNGAIYTAAYRGASTGLEIALAALGIDFKHGKPYHPAVSRGPRNFSVSP
jgi:hypothetical protein